MGEKCFYTTGEWDAQFLVCVPSRDYLQFTNIPSFSTFHPPSPQIHHNFRSALYKCTSKRAPIKEKSSLAIIIIPMNYFVTAFRSSATERPFMPSNKEQPDVSISSLELGFSGLLLDQSMYDSVDWLSKFFRKMRGIPHQQN